MIAWFSWRWKTLSKVMLFTQLFFSLIIKTIVFALNFWYFFLCFTWTSFWRSTLLFIYIFKWIRNNLPSISFVLTHIFLLIIVLNDFGLRHLSWSYWFCSCKFRDLFIIFFWIFKLFNFILKSNSSLTWQIWGCWILLVRKVASRPL
jgi:hypothetical protein